MKSLYGSLKKNMISISSPLETNDISTIDNLSALASSRNCSIESIISPGLLAFNTLKPNLSAGIPVSNISTPSYHYFKTIITQTFIIKNNQESA